MEYTYGNVTTQTATHKFTDVFNTTVDEEKYVTKQLYTHSEPGLSFKYRYVYEEVYMAAYENKPTNVVCTELHLVLEPKSFCKELRAKLLDEVGCEGLTIDDLNVIDVMDNSIAGHVLMARMDTTEDKVEDVRLAVANVLVCIDGLRGMYIDQYQNRIGTTGWDLIKEAKGKIKDALRYTMNQWKKKLK